MPTGIFKLASEMPPAWFLEDSPWSGTLSAFFTSSTGQREMDSPCPAFVTAYLQPWSAPSDLMLPAATYICREPAIHPYRWQAAECVHKLLVQAGWAQPWAQGSKLCGAFSLSYLGWEKQKTHMLRDCAYSYISQLVTAAKYSPVGFP